MEINTWLTWSPNQFVTKYSADKTKYKQSFASEGPCVRMQQAYDRLPCLSIK